MGCTTGTGKQENSSGEARREPSRTCLDSATRWWNTNVWAQCRQEKLKLYRYTDWNCIVPIAGRSIFTNQHVDLTVAISVTEISVATVVYLLLVVCLMKATKSPDNKVPVRIRWQYLIPNVKYNVNIDYIQKCQVTTQEQHGDKLI